MLTPYFRNQRQLINVYHYTKFELNLSSSQFIKANMLLLPQSHISVALLLLLREVRRQFLRPFTQMPEQSRPLPHSLHFVASCTRTSVARLYSIVWQMMSYILFTAHPNPNASIDSCANAPGPFTVHYSPYHFTLYISRCWLRR
jgi:hypothetical protein